jgi:acetyltransferase-like isoleucine patch superfamily enzyme
VVIGEGAVVGAGSVVRESVAPYTIVAGNPAVWIKDRKVMASDKHAATTPEQPG